jgi:hypothetical protein
MRPEWEPNPSTRKYITASILLLGSVIRLIHLAFMRLDLPHDGAGLFMEFAHQIAAHRFRLPCCIPFYTDGGIPFAYPPLPFYVEAVFTEVLALPEFPVANLLPPFVAILALVMFQRLTQELDMTFWTRTTALLAYATMRSAFSDQIEASGLAEAFGSLSLICLAIGMVRAQERASLKRYILVGVLWAFCIVASPGSASASVPTFLIFAVTRFAQLRWRPGLRDLGLLLAAGLTAFLTSSPYWLTVITNHSPQIFLSSLGAQRRVAFNLWETAVQSQFTGHAFLWNAMLFLGMTWALVTGRWPLVAWAIVLRVIPREGWWMASIPRGLLIGFGATEVFASRLVGAARKHKRSVETFVLILGLVLLIVHPVYKVVADKIGTTDSYPEAVAAMEWVRANTPQDARFIVMVNNNVLEWSPRVMQRTVLNENFGTEFTPEKHHNITEFKQRLSDCRDFDCIQSTLVSSDVVSSSQARSYLERGIYLLISKPHLAKLVDSSQDGQTAFGMVWNNSGLAVGLLLSPDFIYQAKLSNGVGVVQVGEIPESIVQGDVIDLELHWVSRNPPETDIEACLSLVDEAGIRRQSLHVRPFEDRGKHTLRTGVISEKLHQFQVDPHLPSDRYALTVALADGGESVTLAHLRVEPLPRAFEPPERIGSVIDARFGDEFQLLGYELVQEYDSLNLTLHWRALRQPETYYKVFVHLSDPATGKVVAQYDAAPRDWGYPTTWWEKGEVVTDEISLSLKNVPEGQYRLGIGLYVPDTGERLTITEPERKQEIPGRLVLPERITLPPISQR